MRSRGFMYEMGAGARKSLVLFWTALFVCSLLLQYVVAASPALAAVSDSGTYSVVVPDHTQSASATTSGGALVTYIGDSAADGSSGTGIFDPFVRLQGSPTEQGYNTNGAKEFNTKTGTWTHAILVSDIPVVTVNGKNYWELFNDINETNSTAYVSLNKVEAYFTSNANLTGYSAGFGANATLQYAFNGAILIHDVNSGSGRADLRYRIPTNGISIPSNCGYLSSGCSTYFVLYSEWGTTAAYTDGNDYSSDGGFEEWKTQQTYATLQIVKHTVGGDGTFGFSVTGTPTAPPVAHPSITTSGGTGATQNWVVSPGTYKITEDSLPASWQLSGATCSLNGGGSTNYVPGSNLVLGATDHAVCTFTNAYIAPGLAITKGVSLTNGSGYGPSLTTTVGTTVYYRIHVSNTGNVPLTGVTLTDNLFDLVAKGCTIPTTLAVGASFNCDYSDTAKVGSTTNTATADSNETPSVDASATVTGQTPILNLEKEVSVNGGAFSHSGSANPGDTLTYRLTITNTGNANATGESVTDNLSSVLAHASWDDNFSQSSGSVDFTSPNLTWSGISIAAGGGTATLTFSVTLDASGWAAGTTDLPNAAVEANSQNCPSATSENPDCSTDTTVTTGTDLGITKAVDPSTIPGGASTGVSYTIVVSNSGDGNTNGNVLVTDNDFPAFYSITGVTCAPTNATCDAAHLTGSGIDLGILGAGGSVRVTVTGTASPNNTTDIGQHVNTAYACEQVVEGDAICVHAPATLNVTLTHVPAIHVVKTASTSYLPFPGGDVTYTYAVTNTGNVPLSNVTLTDDKCAGVTFTGGDANTNQLLDLTETWTFQCTSSISVDTTNVATATGHDGQTVVQATDEATVDVGPQLLITKTITAGAPGGAPVVEGGKVTYTLAYDLTDGPVTNGIITDVLPDGLTYLAGTATDNDEFAFESYDSATRTLIWLAANVTKDGSVTYQVVADEGSVNLPQPLVNTATIQSDQTAPDSDTASVSVGKVEEATGTPQVTPPPTSTLDQVPATPAGNGLLLLLVAIAGFMLVAGVLAPTPARARRRNRRG
jgi:uncharacterized repeat protein (TIGR01451 family)